jgi:hypothetical protein
MGSVVQLTRRRPAAAKPKEKSAREAEESRRSLIVLVGTFTFAAVAMSVAVVVAGSNSWAEAVPMIVCVVVFALLKVFLADAAFFGMLRADQVSEEKEAARRKVESTSGSILRRPVKHALGRMAVGTPLMAIPKGGRSGLALVVRKPPPERGGKR